MTKNVRHKALFKNLRGRSYKGQDLSDANFSYSDIRGADFSNANLSDANFTHALAGLPRYWVIISFLFSVISGFLAGFVAAWNGSFLTSDNHNNFIVGWLSSAILLLFLIISRKKGFAQAFVILIVGIFFIPGTLAGFIAVILNQGNTGNIALNTASVVTVSIFTSVVVTIVITMTRLMADTGTIAVSLVSAVTGALSVPFNANSEIAIEIAQAGIVGITITAGMAFVMILLCASVSSQVLTQDRKHTLILKIALAIASIGGTSFRGANLTGANFTKATLRNTKFQDAILAHTIWERAEKTEFAQLEGTILDNPAVRKLLVDRDKSSSFENVNLKEAYLVGVDLSKKTFKNANLSGANLTAANLTSAILTEANLDGATLHQANLESANLTKAQAIGTDFQNAHLTGAKGLGNWNIDSTTNLDGVNCQFVYLGKEKDENERRPQSGEFATGEFTKLFQIAVGTIDLIFRDGLDLRALLATLKDVQAKNQNTPLKLQSIENKGDGFVVVKISVPEEADRAKIHSELKQSYEEQLTAIEARYQAEIKGKQEQIEIYRQKSVEMAEIAKHLAKEHSQTQIQVQAGKLVVLTIGEGDFESGFPVTALIRTNDHPIPMFFTGKLPPEPKIPQLYQQWQQIYRSQKWFGRILFDEENSVTNFSQQELDDFAQELEHRLQSWLNSEPFRPIERELYSKLIPTEEVLVIIQTKDIQLQRLPWHLWDFFEHYCQAEVALSPTGERKEKSVPSRNQIRVLTILGSSTGIDLEADRQVLDNLPNAETVFLVEPTRKQLHQYLWDQQGWDILCYSGHSSSQADGSTGTMIVNQTDLLTIRELKHALTRAIGRGLQLAIFNSCDGLGLARQLGDLHIPQMIVMREPVPDKVAQEFLKYFLGAFAAGESLYRAARQARERLEGLEDEFPYATWLPVIFQNAAEVGMSWRKLP